MAVPSFTKFLYKYYHTEKISATAPDSQPLLELRDLQVDFETEQSLHTAVHDLSFTLHKGETLAIVGESGSGKSVSSLSILQLLPEKTARYRSGKILFYDRGDAAVDLLQVKGRDLRSIRGSRIAMIFQEPMTSLNPVFTCGDQVMEAFLQHDKISRSLAKERTIELFRKVQLPDPVALFHRYPHQLSGGQKQRVMIAMAMSGNPALLICDEPTTALDVTVQKNILELIRTLQRDTGMGVIFITHDLGLVAGFADRIVVMYKGRMVEQGLVTDVLQHPQHPYTKGLLACRPALHSRNERLPVVGDFWQEDTAMRSMMETNVKNDIGDLAAVVSSESSVQATNKLIEAIDLTVWYPAKKTFLGKVTAYNKAVDGVSFYVAEGETLGLVGESGCGKTTLGRALLRLIEPTKGHLLFRGEDLLSYDASKLRSLRKEIQIIFQDPYSSLNPSITIGNAIAEVLEVHNVLPTARQRRERVMELLQKVSLSPEHYKRYPHEFSGGQRQRIVIARALALSPAFIVCDESVSALDVSVQAQVLNLLNDLKKEFRFTIVFISHDLSVVHYISDRIMVMQQGKIIETGSNDDIYHRPSHPYTKALIAAIPKAF